MEDSLMTSLMDQHSAFLELPPELRNIIYEYVALDEPHPIVIKKKLRPKKGHHIAARSDLILVSRQISEEYTSVIQQVALWPGINLKTRVHDLNFRHVERYLASLRSHRAFVPEDAKTVEVHLTIKSCSGIDSEPFASWVSLSEADRRGLSWTYVVDDGDSGHTFPMRPPHEVDLAFVKGLIPEYDHAMQIYNSLRSWQGRCEARLYHIRQYGSSRQGVIVEWTHNPWWRGSYTEVTRLLDTDVVTELYVSS